MFIKNYGSPFARILANIFFKKSLVLIANSTALEDILLYIKRLEDEDDSSDEILSDVIGSLLRNKIVSMFYDVNSNFTDDTDALLEEDQLYDLPDYISDTFGHKIKVLYKKMMDVYEVTPTTKLGKIMNDYFIQESGRELESLSEREIGRLLDEKLCERLSAYGIFSVVESEQLARGLVLFLIAESKAMTKIITDALDFGIPDYQLEGFPEKERIITALEIGYVLLKYVPVIREDFSDIILPKLLSSLCLDENDNAAERISTRLKQLKDTFQAQTLLTDDISQYLQTL